jgi:hypothetical protein
MRTITMAALVGLSVWLGAAAPAGAGAITGTVRFVGDAVEPKKLKVTVDLRNVVVSLVTPPPDAK